MIHEGQEFARSKVIPLNIDEPDTNKGKIDHNTYDKDNETNYLNFEHAKINSALLDYYKGLIDLRKKYPAFRHASRKDIEFVEDANNKFFFGYKVSFSDKTFFVLLNANPDNSTTFEIGNNRWEILADKNSAGTDKIKVLSGSVKIPAISGMILKLANE